MSVSRVPLQKRSLSSHHLMSAGSPIEPSSQLIVIKPEANCGGSVMSVSPACSTFTLEDNMGHNTEDGVVKSDLSGDSHSGLFTCNWIDSNRSSAELEMVAIKPEPVADNGGHLRQYDDIVTHGLELSTFVGSRDQYLRHGGGSFESQNDLCLGNVGSSQQRGDGMVNSVDMMSSDMAMDGVRPQQMLVNDSLGSFGFSPSPSPLISSQSMPLLPTYTASEVMKGTGEAGYRMAGIYADKSQSFADPSFTYSGSTSMCYAGAVQHDIVANEPQSGYGGCFAYSDHGPHEVMHFHNTEQPRNDQSDMYVSSVPRTPTLYTAIGPKQVSQQAGHRTPRTPYTPSTPGRSSRFPFPSITEGAVVGNCQHRYQKSTAYHPYGHQHTPAAQTQQLTTLGPASPHYLNQRHVVSMAHEMDQQQFRHDVAHAQQEIEQRLQQLQHEDKMKQMMMSQQTNSNDTAVFPVMTAHCQPTSTADSISPDTSVRNTAMSYGAHTGQSLSPVDEVLQVLMQDAPEMSTGPGNVASVVPLTTALQMKNESIRGVSTSAYPHSASDSLLSQLTFSSLAYDQTELKKVRRKHKPEPLVIPPDMNNFGPGSAEMQWNCTASERHKTQLPPDSSAGVTSTGMNSGSGTQWVQRPPQVNGFGEPRSAPPFRWSSAVMCTRLTTYCFIFLSAKKPITFVSCLLVCLSVKRITEKVTGEFSRNYWKGRQQQQGVPRRQPHRRSGLATLPSVGAIP